jgi:U4/U6.U5 tri-snRNP component SNU23
MSTNLNYKQAANVERRTWDREKYEAKARARAAANADDLDGQNPSKARRLDNNDHDDPSATSSSKSISTLQQLQDQDEEEQEEFTPAEKGRAGPELSQRAFLKSRSQRISLDAKVGSTEFVQQPTTTTQTKPGEEKSISIKVCIRNLNRSLFRLI